MIPVAAPATDATIAIALRERETGLPRSSGYAARAGSAHIVAPDVVTGVVTVVTTQRGFGPGDLPTLVYAG